MSTYFKYFPKGIHTDILATDITKRVDLASTVLNDPYVYYPHLIEGDDRAEDIARLYYGDVSYTWLVWHSARIVDPYYDWPITYINFQKMLMKKYEDLSGTTGQAVVAWTQNTTIDGNILHYKNSDDTIHITPDTYTLSQTLSTGFVAGDWTPVRIYDFEEAANDDKRTINLLNDELAPQALREFKSLMNKS